MDLSKAVTLFEDLKAKIANHGDYVGGNETVTRVLLVDPVLKMLGWDVTDPSHVVMEFAAASQKKERADYLLRVDDDVSRAIVEAKKYDHSFRPDNHKTQADGYANYAGVEFFIITDGARWALYKRDVRTPLEALKPVIEFDIEQDDPVKCALNALGMWRSNLISDGGPTEASQSFVPSLQEQSVPLELSPDLQYAGWIPLTKVDKDPKWEDSFPRLIRFEDSEEVELKSMIDLLNQVILWIWSKRPVAKDWLEFSTDHGSKPVKTSRDTRCQQLKLKRGLYFNKISFGRKRRCLGVTLELLDHFGYDPSKVHVKFN